MPLWMRRSRHSLVSRGNGAKFLMALTTDNHNTLGVRTPPFAFRPVELIAGSQPFATGMNRMIVILKLTLAYVVGVTKCCGFSIFYHSVLNRSLGTLFVRTHKAPPLAEYPHVNPLSTTSRLPYDSSRALDMLISWAQAWGVSMLTISTRTKAME
jgi:hypothetical protein